MSNPKKKRKLQGGRRQTDVALRRLERDTREFLAYVDDRVREARRRDTGVQAFAPRTLKFCDSLRERFAELDHARKESAQKID